MPPPAPLAAAEVYRRCMPDCLAFETTADLPEVDDFIGQHRAEESVAFGIAIDRPGYNMFVMGRDGSGRSTLIGRFLRNTARGRPTPDDWVYVHNFAEPHRPLALSLPPGQGQKLRREMEEMIEDLRTAIPAAFESESYRQRVGQIESSIKQQQDAALKTMADEAETQGLQLTRTPSGLAFLPVQDGRPMEPDTFRALSEEDRQRFEAAMAHMQERLRDALRDSHKSEREQRSALRKLNRETVANAVSPVMTELREMFGGLHAVVAHLATVERDVIENAQSVLTALTASETPAGSPGGPQVLAQGQPAEGPVAAAQFLRRYEVNVLIEHGHGHGAPVVECDFPAHGNLMGRIEHIAQFGTLTTDHMLIKPGDLHRANGGYLLVDARKLLSQPFAWQELKRALSSGEIPIEQPGAMTAVMYTQTLQPQPVKLEVKVVLFGDRSIYSLLQVYDAEFAELFKVAVDFAETMDRTSATENAFGRAIGQMARRHQMRNLSCAAVCRIVEHASRLASDQRKLSTHMRSILDVLTEADHVAARRGHNLVEREDVQAAIDAMVRRIDRPRDMLQERIDDGTILIDTAGGRIGQVNGLSVLDAGGFMFGKPSRITARVRLGKGEVIDIERNVDLGGPLHTKGVMILAGYLGAKYSPAAPLALSATLVFEQSYGPVDGDSASSAELYALLSALSEMPIDQAKAVTGSVNQFGQVQAIGGVNEKIEGFFEACAAQGLTGDQGVLIPASNVSNLMLREEVATAIGDGRFHVWPVSTVDQGIELLTGVPAGEADDNGAYPAGSINARVSAKLAELATAAREHLRYVNAGD
ncbi:MAG: Lon protease family protein [Alphaproteobacteria bacterium]